MSAPAHGPRWISESFNLPERSGKPVHTAADIMQSDIFMSETAFVSVAIFEIQCPVRMHRVVTNSRPTRIFSIICRFV